MLLYKITIACHMLLFIFSFGVSLYHYIYILSKDGETTEMGENGLGWCCRCCLLSWAANTGHQLTMRWCPVDVPRNVLLGVVSVFALMNTMSGTFVQAAPESQSVAVCCLWCLCMFMIFMMLMLIWLIDTWLTQMTIMAHWLTWSNVPNLNMRNIHPRSQDQELTAQKHSATLQRCSNRFQSFLGPL